MFNASPGRYCTRDVISDPPTSVMIVRDTANFPSNATGGDVYTIDENDVEITEGWETRFGKSQLSICFMHSFGKCSGRCNNNPATCHQIHLRRAALDSLRATYRNRTRSLFSRTIKAHLSDDMRQTLSRIARKDLTLKYLEYRASDVEATDGLQNYEAAYRSWLLSPPGTPDVFHDTCVFQCPIFATGGTCSAGERCGHIHGDVRNAQVRDHMVSNALRQLATLSCGPSFPSNVPPPPPFHAMQMPHQQYFPSPSAMPFHPPQAQQPMYVILMPQQQHESMQGASQYVLPHQQIHMVPQQQSMYSYGLPQHHFVPMLPQTQSLQFPKSFTPGDQSPASMTPDRTTESTETFTSGNLWGDDLAQQPRQVTNEDIFQTFRNLAVSNSNVLSPRSDVAQSK